MTADALSKSIGISRATYNRLIKEDSSEWLTEAVKMLKAMKVPITEIRKHID